MKTAISKRRNVGVWMKWTIAVLFVLGAGFKAKVLEPLLTSKHPNFRPVDVKMGPDGAVYVADWYNSIINHAQHDFRDPRRDHNHGRIWRISHKKRPLVAILITSSVMPRKAPKSAAHLAEDCKVDSPAVSASATARQMVAAGIGNSALTRPSGLFLRKTR